MNTRMVIHRIVAFSTVLVAGLWALIVSAQGTRADYERALSVGQRTANTVFKQSVRPHWLAGNTRFWYRNDLADGAREFVLVDAAKGERKPAFDHVQLAKALSQATGKDLQSQRLPVDKLDLGSNDSTLFLSSNGQWWLLDLRDYSLHATNRTAEAVSSLRSSNTPRPSRRAGEDTSITFINRTTNDVVTYWMTEDGERRRYATVKAGARFQQHTFAGHVWLVTDTQGHSLGVFEGVEGGGDAIIDGHQNDRPRPAERRRGRRVRGPESPDGQWRAFIKDHNVSVLNLKNGETISLSRDGTEDDAYTDRLSWSPDSKKLVVLRTTKGDERKVYLIESSPKDQLQPKLHSFDYAKPGDSIPISKPHLFDVSREKEIPVSDELFPNPWSISDVRWAPDSKRFTFLYNQRGHQVLRIVAVDAADGCGPAHHR